MMNEEKRESFMKNAEGRVNKIINYIDLLKDMAKSTYYDYTKEDVENMFNAIETSISEAKSEYIRKFEITKERKAFSFSNQLNVSKVDTQLKQEEDEDSDNIINLTEED